jgi:ribosomal protein L12E/L44/L45/RPP1/RPP2
MASPEPAAHPSLAKEAPAPTAAPSAAPAAEQEGPPQPQEPVPEAEAEKAEGEEAEEEEEGECGFCLFMKAGGCRDTFVAWEECVEAAQKDGDDMVERCHEATANLKKCMDAHADYYAPVLRAEEAVNERAEAEAAAAAAADDAAKDKGGEPATDSENKEEGVPQPAASSPPAAGVGNDAENKEEAVPQPAASSVPAAAEEAVAEKV